MIQVAVGLILGGAIGFSACALIAFRKEEKQEEINAGKCKPPNNIILKPDGIHELDPCVYEEVERHEGCTVMIDRCRKCGHIEISWQRGEENDL